MVYSVCCGGRSWCKKLDHEILFKKLWHYGIRGVAMTAICLFGAISSDLLEVNFGVPQGSILGPLLFHLHINNFHNSIRFSSSFHFADNTDLQNIKDTINDISKFVSNDLRELSFWLNHNKITLNVAKTESFAEKELMHVPIC